jgi:hypothetical protein
MGRNVLDALVPGRLEPGLLTLLPGINAEVAPVPAG